MDRWLCWITYVGVCSKIPLPSADRFVGSRSLLLLNLVWFLRRCIVGWTIVIVFGHSTALVSHWQLVCSLYLNLGSLIDSWPRAICSCYTCSYWLASGYPTPSVFLRIWLFASVIECLKVRTPAFLSDLCYGTADCSGSLWFEMRTFEVISLCRDTWHSWVQCLLLWMVRQVGMNCRLDSEISHGWSWNTFARHLKHTRSKLVFRIRHALLKLYHN